MITIIIVIAISVILSVGISSFLIGKAIFRYARIVDDVFFEKDQKREDLEYRISDLTVRVQDLESRPTFKKNYSDEDDF